MLFLTRKPGEGIFLKDSAGNPVAKIFVSEIRGRQVHFGLKSPDDINIVREELLSMPESIRLEALLKSGDAPGD